MSGPVSRHRGFFDRGQKSAFWLGALANAQLPTVCSRIVFSSSTTRQARRTAAAFVEPKQVVDASHFVVFTARTK